MTERITGREVSARIVLVLFCGWWAFVGGAVFGEKRGWREMKHWQDEWYAAHPAVKEVRTYELPSEKCANVGGEYVMQKGSGSLVTFRCELPAPPKPQKESKRSITSKDCFVSSGVAGVHSRCPFFVPAQPIPEKEPAPKEICINWRGREVPCTPRENLFKPEPWDCGDGKPTTDPCPAAASHPSEKPQ